MSSKWAQHLKYEARFTRFCRPHWALLAVVVFAVMISLAWAETSIHFFDFTPSQYWTVIATQGGAQGWPPLFAYLIALYGVRAWRYDATGETAYVAFLGFGDRWRTALIRICATCLIAAGLSVVSWCTSLATASIVGSPPLTSDIWRLVLVKGAWTLMCGVTYCQVGAMFCVLWRSRGAALTTLLVVPWLIEPILIQIVTSTPSLSAYTGAMAYLPFTAVSAILGSHAESQVGFGSGSPQLAPWEASYYCVVAGALCVAVLMIRYCLADGERQRDT